LLVNFSINNIFSKSAWSPLPTGDGQKLSLRVQSNGKAFRSYNFSFTEPWLGGKKRNSLTFSFYSSKFSNAFDPLTGLPDRKRSDSNFLKTTGVSVIENLNHFRLLIRNSEISLVDDERSMKYVEHAK